MSGKWKRAVVIGGVAVAALGVGGVAWAASADSTVNAPAAAVAPAAVSGTTSSATSAATKPTKAKKAGKNADKDGHKLARDLVKRVQHATWVGGGKDGQYVTHQAIKGTVTAVNSSSITVKAADGYTETFKVDANTKIHVAGDKKAGDKKAAASGTISQVKSGDKAGVLGTGATGPTATQILVGNGKKATPTTPSTTSGSTTTG